MSIYTYRRIWALVLVILALLLAALTVKGLEMLLTEEFKCKAAVTVTVASGDTITGIASQQVQSGNCRGYQPLYYYLTEKNGVDLQPGDRIEIPLHD